MNAIMRTTEQLRWNLLMLKIIYTDVKKEVNGKVAKFKVGDYIRISKYKNIFAKGYTPNWSEEVFIIKKVKNTGSWTYVIKDLNGEEILGTFYERELQKTTLQEKG